MKSTDKSELVKMITSSALPPDVKVGLLKILDPSASLPSSEANSSSQHDTDTAGHDIAPRSW